MCLMFKGGKDREMPSLGEVTNLKERANNKFIWLACRNCGKERWVQLSHTTLPQFTNLCAHCWKTKPKGPYPRGINSPNWKGQPRLMEHGYIVVPLDSNNPFYLMSDCEGCVYEHRLVVAKHLGRCLEAQEIVHHKNGIKTDNRIENLQLLPSRFEHVRLHKSEKL